MYIDLSYMSSVATDGLSSNARAVYQVLILLPACAWEFATGLAGVYNVLAPMVGRHVPRFEGEKKHVLASSTNDQACKQALHLDVVCLGR